MEAVTSKRPSQPKEQKGDTRPVPLQSGDRLTRAEFERRYHLHPEIKKAELIEGVVYVPSPVRIQRHSSPHLYVATWAGVYLSATPRIGGGDNGTVRLDLENEPQPDVMLWIQQGGRAIVDEDDYLAGAPEFAVEVAATSAAYDLHDKLRAYRRNGVQEYLVLLTHDEEVRWFNWQSGEMEEIEPDEQGVLRSRALPGLWLDVDAFWRGDLRTVLNVLQRGIDTPEHAAFVEHLQTMSS